MTKDQYISEITREQKALQAKIIALEIKKRAIIRQGAKSFPSGGLGKPPTMQAEIGEAEIIMNQKGLAVMRRTNEEAPEIKWSFEEKDGYINYRAEAYFTAPVWGNL